jgi:uncharacterized protein YndB with AHSA1/START domain
MTKPRSITHGSFTIDRTYPDATPARVFDAFARPEAKARWFAGPPGWEKHEASMEFRVGGREVAAGRHGNGMVSRFEAHYYDIVPDERIVYAYEMHIDGNRISVSLATIEMTAKGTGTRLVVTEHGAFLDGYDDSGSRERGTIGLLDQLGKALAL